MIGDDPRALGHPTRRAMLGGAGAAAATALLTPACAAVREEAVSLPDFRRPGDVDDTEALQRAFATGKPVHAPAGRYVIGNDAAATLPSGATLFGDGRDRTIITRSYRRPRGFILHCDSGSPDRARNIRGIRIRDLTFADEVRQRGFEEFSYLVMLNGVTDVLLERVGFTGFRGDGLHFGSSTSAKTERHNVDLVVRDCHFDGLTSNNRNGISVIDAERLLVERCSFRNIARAGDGSLKPADPMNPLVGLAAPGAIDLEPNGDAFAVIRDVTIRGNTFEGGGGYAVAMLLTSNNVVSTPQHNILVEDNIVRDRFGGFEAFGFPGAEAVSAGDARAYAITVRNNRFERCGKPFVIDGIRGMTVTGNSLVDCRDHAELGYHSEYANVTLADNLFERVGGPTPGFGLWVRGGVGARITGNRFVDCGTRGERGGVAMAFVGGNARRLTVANNRFASPTGRMAQAAMKFRVAQIDRATLTVRGNEALRGALPVAEVLGGAA